MKKLFFKVGLKYGRLYSSRRWQSSLYRVLYILDRSVNIPRSNSTNNNSRLMSKTNQCSSLEIGLFVTAQSIGTRSRRVI